MSGSEAAKPLRRLIPLDMLRGLAALSVVLYHYTSRFSELYSIQAWPSWFHFGHVGVHVFFIISGYVIFMTLERIRAGGAGLADFLKARFYRLYPVFWVAVIITFVSISFVGLPGRETSFTDALLNLTMLPRFFGANYVDGVYWSLEVELLFYLGVGMLYFTRAPRSFPILILAWALIGRCLVIMAENLPWLAIPRVLLLADWLYLFALGMAIYLYKNSRLSNFLFLAFVACFAWGLLTSLNVQESLIVVCAAVYVFFADKVQPAYTSMSRALGWLGAISYPLYLVHQNLGYSLMIWFSAAGLSAILSMVIALVLVMAVATVLTYGVERPLMEWVRGRRVADQKGHLAVEKT